MVLPDYPPEWWDVSFALRSGYIEGFLRGHREGHRAGFEQGMRVAGIRDDEFIRSLADEIRRRDLDDDRIDTSDVRQWISKLIESLDAKARRDDFDQRVRQDREQRQTPQPNWRAA